MKPLVKICGLTNLDDAVISFECGADMLGLIFAESPRQVSISTAELIASKLSGKVKLVGVFASPNDPMISEVCKEIRLDMLQIYFAADNHRAGDFPFPLLPAYWIRKETDLRAIDVSGALLDLKHAPELLNSTPVQLDLPDLQRTILAGGLNSYNVDSIIKKFHPLGVDTARGVESSPGMKDRRKLEKFIRKVKK